MVAPKVTHSPFLDLPLEIREQIYGGLLSDPSCKSVQMLRTSQQIYAEAQPFLFKRPLAFASQFDFYDWVKRSNPQNLRHVQCIYIKLLDVIAYEGLDPSAIQAYRKNSPSPIVKSYEDDLARFTTALKGVPNVRNLTLYKNHTAAESDPFRDFYQSCFALITQNFSALRCLTFYVDQVPLDFLSSLRSLQSLRFTGFSVSSPMDTLKVLQKLSKLEEVNLFGPPPGISFQQRRGYTGPKTIHSMTADVIRGISPLKSFTICEIRDPLSKIVEYFFESSMLAALSQTHGRSLRTLRISTDFLPSMESRSTLAFLLSTSALQHVELGWPGLDGKVVDGLPPSLHSLQITVSNTLTPEDLVGRLVSRRSQLTNLTEVVIRMDWRESEVKELSGKIEMAIAKLKTVGIQATTGKWYPVILDDVNK